MVGNREHRLPDVHLHEKWRLPLIELLALGAENRSGERIEARHKHHFLASCKTSSIAQQIQAGAFSVRTPSPSPRCRDTSGDQFGIGNSSELKPRLCADLAVSLPSIDMTGSGNARTGRRKGGSRAAPPPKFQNLNTDADPHGRARSDSGCERVKGVAAAIRMPVGPIGSTAAQPTSNLKR